MPYLDQNKQRAFQRKWIKDKRAEHFKGKKCAKCGKAITSSSAELDHKKPKMNRTGHKIWSRSKEVRSKEIAKTQILCKSCHREKTNKQLTKMAEDLNSILQSDSTIYLEEQLKKLIKEYKNDNK